MAENLQDLFQSYNLLKTLIMPQEIPRLSEEGEESIYDIIVEDEGKEIPFKVEPISTTQNKIVYNIYKDDEIFLQLECCTDNVGDSLTATPEYKNVDAALVEKIAYVVMSSEE